MADVYQHELLARMSDKKFMDECGSVLHPDIFDREFEKLVQEVLGHWRDKRLLTWGQLSQIARRAGLKVFPRPTPNRDGYAFDRKEIESYAIDRRLRLALSTAQILREQGEYDKAAQIVAQTHRDASYGTLQGRDLLDIKATQTGRENLLGTGLETLDGWFNGGVGSGDLGIVLAATGGGKTTWLVWITTVAMMAGKRVLFITLEDPQAMVESRMMKSLTGRETINVQSKAWVAVRNRMKRRKGAVTVVEYDALAVSTNELDTRLSRDKYDVLIVDYADFLRSPSRGAGLSWENLAEIFLELRNLARRHHIPVWTASQANREAYEGGIIQIKHTGGALAKAQIARQVISLNRMRLKTRQRQAIPEGCSIGSLMVCKNTHGPSDVNMIYEVDWVRNRFKEVQLT